MKRKLLLLIGLVLVSTGFLIYVITYDVKGKHDALAICLSQKGIKMYGASSITSHEWETARRLQDDYWLYVVENSFDSPKITSIQNPHEKFKDSVRTEEVIDVRYVIDDWKSNI